MKTTLNISDVTMREVKREAARRGMTISELVESALRVMIEPERRDVRLPPLPTFGSGGLRANIANRDALHEVELDHRLTAYRKKPNEGSPWGIVRERIRVSR